ncbi:YabP/YqfC family sporulation protein [Intestinibacillus massiliensis]|uniref:YabP/YqfC family sporulation protein n=1 Tax=Intestinibacillus massiliensis TaxID=1871029 RepID=UPI000B364139|nr:YabP/YqfC family sporulation protein [Intestinibacillus massiliensis]MCB6366224.1 YabP/YqfC family sporulation protein [Intestinibacillus massiliensis]
MKEGLGARLMRQAQASFLAEDFGAGVPRIEILGDKRVLVENHKGILEYGDTLMRINCGHMVVKIVGDGLELRALSLSELAVTGKILSLEYVT